MRKTTGLALALFTLLSAPGADAATAAPADLIKLVDVFPGIKFDRPVFAKVAPDGTPRMFVGEQAGIISVLPLPAKPGTKPAEAEAKMEKKLFLDLSAKISRLGNEEGLLDMAFHPDFAKNGRFFLHYSAKYRSAKDRRNILASFQVDSKDANKGDAASEKEILVVPQPYSNHNGGWTEFGPDGMLYLALGDGGSAGDPLRHGQNRETLLGTILRIDVNRSVGKRNYAIPKDNPFVRRGGSRGEIWAYGLRNAWRCSFDPADGTLWAGDVGQNKWEEINIIRKGGNYGWSFREGTDEFRKMGRRPLDKLIEPVMTYEREYGISVTGGHVYRGKAMPSLVGYYFYGDFSTGNIWALHVTNWRDLKLVGKTGESIASFGVDHEGELYVCSHRGQILRIEAN